MFRLWLATCAIVFAPFANAADEAPKKDHTTDQIVYVLLAHEVTPLNSDVRDVPLCELLAHLATKHDLTFVINEESFRALGNPNIKEEKPKFASTPLKGLRLHQFLRVVCDSLGATYLIRNNTIEIVPVQYAAKLTKALMLPVQGSDTRQQLSEPLVSFIVKEKPLNEVVADIANMYDLTVVVSPQAGEARTGPVSARLLNMPAEKALELLALQSDLRLVRRGAAFLITSKKHANEIATEEFEKERQAIELKKLRSVKPAMPPAPEKPPVLLPPEIPKPQK